MTITPFNVLPSLPNGTKLEAIAGNITRIGKHSTGTNAHGPWSIQIIDMQDGTGTAKICLKDRPELPGNWQGHAVQFAGEKSIAVDDYQKDASKPPERRIKVTAAASMTQVQAGQHQTPPAQAYQQPPQHQPAPQAYQQPAPAPTHYQQQPSPPPQQPPPQQQSAPALPQFAGQTIGMAMNNACALVMAAHDADPNFAAFLNSREFSLELHNIASDILRVSKHLENGHLAKPAKERETSAPLHRMPEQT